MVFDLVYCPGSPFFHYDTTMADTLKKKISTKKMRWFLKEIIYHTLYLP